jgi:signal transduction histidine kinase
VDGAVWGNIYAGTTGDEPIPDDVESRLGDFTDLVSTAIANSDAREKVGRLVDEQGALRRVATLVARGVQPQEVFAAVSEEVGWVFGSQYAGVGRYEPDGSAVVIVGVSEGISNIPIGTRWPLEDFLATAAVLRTGRPARNDKSDWEDAPGPVADSLRELGIVSTVAAPIVVEGKVWGAITVSDAHQRLPPDAEERLAAFTELVATAIANAESRTELAVSEALAHDLAREQAALRRVAALVAGGASSTAVFDAVAQEVAQLFQLTPVLVACYEDDGATMAVLAAHPASSAFGPRWPLDGPSVAAEVLRSGRPVRIEDWTGLPGTLAAVAREHGLTRVAGAPIIVDGRVWGLVAVAGPPDERLPEDVEDRLAEFTELLGTAIANAESRAELDASRARIVATADATRRRIERDLHDGIQQWLVAVALKARKAAAFGPSGAPQEEFSRIADDLETVLAELREISRGIHPAILSNAGLDNALEALARRSAIRVALDIDFEGRYEPSVEATVYYVVAESITNAVKHAHASVVAVRGAVRDGTIELEIQDDGVGGAEPSRGSGITGLKDRVDTLGGTISFSSPAGAGTTIRMRLPVSPPDKRDRLLGSIS